MKTLLMALITVAVSGCAVYPAPYDGYGASQPYGVQPSVSIYGSGVYRYGDGQTYPSRRPRVYDQDHDGVPNRLDRDRDGDGVPNRLDARPYDPRFR